ncbi:unnamed protein product [Spirodela intermedia]|uniref:WRC domain-containing protein n=1 Tax=Spirodela intermedia TaxID=51605 RepID=A0A7I8KU41_SPIIN|nr:unnamed protein product [Spirodela intermedia]
MPLAGVGEEFPLKKRRGGFLIRGTRSGGDEDDGAEDEQEEEKALVENGGLIERESKAMSYGTRRRSTFAAATDDTCGGGGGGATATIVKEEGGLLLSAAGPSGKKRRSPAVLMEGSRCSRVNGRGWRCCQQTLVGYSLCEHHLGKGRLRSMNSVRCNGRGRKKETAAPPSPTLQPGEKIVKAGKRRKKIGMVKARSISSLLHQPHLPTPTTTVQPVSSPSAGTISASLGYAIDHDSVMA